MYAGHPDQHFGPTTYAQHGDDLMVLNLFGLLGISRPSYLDLGAHHPTIISNTRLLYERGSRGVNVEANPELIQAFERERPEDRNLCLGVGPAAGTGTLHMYSNTSGRNTLSVFEVEAVKDIMPPLQRQMSVPVRTVNEIVAEFCFNGRFPSFLSCDIEGLDLAVLESADFDELGMPMVICVETRRRETANMVYLLGDKGFALYCRMGENLFFVQKKLAPRVY